LSFSDRSGEPVVSLDTSSEHEEMPAFGICYSVLGRGKSKRQLGSVDSAQIVRERRLGETRSSIETVMISDRQRIQS
jgi:hypothetical protein